MIPDEAVQAARVKLEDVLGGWFDDTDAIRQILEAAAPHMLAGEVEWTVFRAIDGPNGSPAENLRYSTKAGAQESINSRYSTPELWEPRSRVVGEWSK